MQQRFNSRRLVILIFVVFIVVLSFFAGKHFGSTTYIQPQDVQAGQGTQSDRQGIPPDSLSH